MRDSSPASCRAVAARVTSIPTTIPPGGALLALADHPTDGVAGLCHPAGMTPRRGLSAGAITIVLGAFCLVSLAIGAIVNRTQTTTPAPPAASDPFDRGAFDRYWAGPNVTPRTRNLVTSVDWSGSVLTAHTQLVADSDAIEPATTICGALSGFWVGDFHSVRVLDGADQVLVSRRTAGETCTWRR